MLEVHSDVGVKAVEEAVEFLKRLRAVIPEAEDVVYTSRLSNPKSWSEVVRGSFLLPVSHINVRERTTVGPAHRSASKLEVLAVVEKENIAGKEEPEHGEECCIRPSRVTVVEEGFRDDVEALFNRDVVVEIVYIHGEKDGVRSEREIVL